MDGLTANSSGWRDDFRRSIVVAREQGLKSVALKVLARVAYRHVLLFRLEIDGNWEMVDSDVELRVSQLGEEDIPAYASFRGCEEEEVRRRFAEGHFSFVTWTGDRISSGTWMQDGQVWIPDVDAYLPLAKGELYTYDSWTGPEFRQHHVSARRARIVTRHLARQGYTGYAAFVLPENTPGLRMVEKLGMRRAGFMAYLQLGPLRLDVLKLEHERPRVGLRRSPRSLRKSPLAPSI